MWSCWNFEIIIWHSLYSTTTTYTTTTIIGKFFFSFTCFFVFTEQLYSSRLCYYTRPTPAHANMIWDWFCLFYLHLGQPPPHNHCHQPSDDERRCHHNSNHSYLPHHLISMFFLAFYMIFFVLQTLTEQLYSFRLCYYTWPPPARANTTRGWFCLFYLHSG